MFTFTYFNQTSVHGWWLRLTNPSLTVLNQLEKKFGRDWLEYRISLLNAGTTLFVNGAGGYHTLGKDHKPLAQRETTALVWPTGEIDEKIDTLFLYAADVDK